jgi:DNA adenine methylase
MIDKINFHTKIGYDADKYTIAVLNGLKDGVIPPYEVSKEEYMDVKNNKDKYSDFLVGYIGYELSFGAKFFGGYAKRDDFKRRGDIYSYRHCIEQSKRLKDIAFECRDFRDINGLKNCVVYVDPPYKNTTPYKNEFPYNEFYDWCRKISKDNVVLISEYSMPDDFKCIWQKEIKVTMDSNRRANDKKNNRVEKLFVYNK